MARLTNSQYAIRHARAALARLYNDRTEVINRLAPALEAAFNSPTAPGSSSSTASDNPALANGLKPNGLAAAPSLPSSSMSTPSAADQASWPERAVARVNSVAAGSPAEDAVSLGMDTGMEIG